jgi:UDP-N-acetylmuramoylalanine--D-glutamate ligase
MPSAHIIGLGRSGIAAARLLKREEWDVSVSDRNVSEVLVQQQQALRAEGINVYLGCQFDPVILEKQTLSHPELVVVSPGAPWDLPGLVYARELGIETIGEIELAWRYLRGYPWIGITGTNGKTTTTALIAAIFKAAGLSAPACGNIGYSACDLLLSEAPIDWVIAELSSYQIESSPTLAPKIGVWTTFTPDHLGRHGTLEHYRDIKASLLDKSQQQVLNADDFFVRQIGIQKWPNSFWTSTQGKKNLPTGSSQGVFIEDGWVMIQDEPILPVASLRMLGVHNQQNLLMAVAVAHLAGIEKAAIAQAIATFPGVPHRLEHICTWQGINFINDSKATNYDAAQVGLVSVQGPVVLIAGGEAKQGDDSCWIQTIQAKAAAVLLIGEAAPIFAQRLKQVNYSNTEIVETMEKAVPRAAKLAQDYQAAVVLLSPACASFDQYENFEQRGDHFRQLCLELLS